MEFFIEKQNLIELSVFVGAVDGKLVAGKKQDVKDQKAVQIKFWIKQMDYSMNALIASKSVKVINGQVHIDPALLRYSKLVTLLSKWNIQTKDGKDIPVDEIHINKLHPLIAAAISDMIEEVSDSK